MTLLVAFILYLFGAFFGPLVVVIVPAITALAMWRTRKQMDGATRVSSAACLLSSLFSCGWGAIFLFPRLGLGPTGVSTIVILLLAMLQIRAAFAERRTHRYGALVASFVLSALFVTVGATRSTYTTPLWVRSALHDQDCYLLGAITFACAAAISAALAAPTIDGAREIRSMKSLLSLWALVLMVLSNASAVGNWIAPIVFGTDGAVH